MSGAFDPYYKWLGIPRHEQPPDHYRLLGLARFEPDTDVIESAADRQMAHVRSYQSGKHGDESQRLLNEIAAARLCLLTSDKKAAYDAQLKSNAPKPAPERSKAVSPSASDASLGAALERPPVLTTVNQPVEDSGISSAVVEPLPPVASDIPAPSNMEFVPKPAPVPDVSNKAASASNPVPILLAVGGAAAVLFLLIVGGIAAMFLFGSSGDEPVVVNPNPPPPPELVRPSPPIRPPNVNPNPPNHPTPVAYVPPPTGPLRATANLDGTVAQEPQVEPAESVVPEQPVASFFPELPEDTRAQIPSEEERATPREQIAELFPADSARTFQEKSDLARQLLDTASGSESKPGAHYELLDQARQVASDAGHLKSAFEAVDKLAKTYRVDELALKCVCVNAATGATTPAATRTESVKLATAIVDDLFAEDRFQEAAKLIGDLQVLARKASDRNQLEKINALKQRGSDLYTVYRTAKPAVESLKADPTDESAAKTAGSYFALAKGDWQLGLPMLAAGNDEQLKGIANAEMEVPTETKEIKELADRWRSLAENSSGIEAEHQRARAAMWYRRIASRLSGLSKVEVDGHIKELGDITADGGRSFRPVATPTIDPPARPTNETGPPVGQAIDLLAKIDTKKHVDRGEWGFFGEGSLVVKPINLARLQVPFAPPATYELELEVLRASGSADLAIGLIYRGQPCHVIIDGWEGTASAITAAENGRNIATLKTSGPYLANGKPSNIKCIVQSQGFVVMCDDKEVIRHLGSPRWDAYNQGWKVADPTQLALGANHSEYRFTSMTLTPLAPGPLPPKPSPQAPPISAGKPIDLLAQIDPTQHAVAGVWRKAGDRLMTPMQQFARLQIPVHPPQEYDIDLEVMRMGGYLDLCIGLVYQGKQCHMSIDRYRPPITELLVDSTSNRGKEAVATYRGTGHLLARAQRAKVKCEVREEYVRLVVNDKEVLRYQGDATWDGINEDWKIPDDQALMIGCWSSVFQIYSMTLTPISGEATVAPTGGGSTEADGAVVDLLGLIDLQKHVVAGDWEIRNGVLFTSRDPFGRVTIPYEPPESYRIEADVVQRLGTGPILLGLVHQGKQFAVEVGKSEGRIHAKDGTSQIDRRGAFVQLGRPTKIICDVTPDRVVVTSNGQTAIDYQGDANRLSLPQSWAVPSETSLFIGSSRALFHVSSLKLTPLKVASATTNTASTVNLLPLVNPSEHVVAGSWRMVNNGENSYTLSTPNSSYSEIRVPYIPAREYDLLVEMAMGETDIDVEWKLPYGGSEFNCKINNNTSLVVGKKRILRCEVRKSGVRIFLDDKLAGQLQRDSTLAMNANAKPFRIVSRNTSVNVTSVQLTELSGRGRKMP